MTRRDNALAVLVMVIWGVNFVAIDDGLKDVPPLLFVAIRFCVVLLPAFIWVAKPDMPWRHIAAVGLLMSAGQFGLLYAGLVVVAIVAWGLRATAVGLAVRAAGALGPEGRGGVGEVRRHQGMQ